MIVENWNNKNIDIKEKYNRLILIITKLKSMLDLKKTLYSQEIIDEFSHIEKFLSNLSVNEIEIIYDKLIILGTTDPEVIRDLGKDFQLNEQQFIRILMPVGIFYLIALKYNMNAINIEDSLLFYAMNAMRCTPLNKYKEAIDKETYPKLTKILTNPDIKFNIGKDTDEIRLIFNRLVNNIKESIEDYDETNIDIQMEEFISDYVRKKIERLVNMEEFNIDDLMNNLYKAK